MAAGTCVLARCNRQWRRENHLRRRSHWADFDAQCRQAFRNIEKTLVDAGAKLGDLVTMTVFLIDARYTTRMTELRADIFKKDFPASAAIAVSGFANPDILIEIQGIAVIAQLK